MMARRPEDSRLGPFMGGFLLLMGIVGASLPSVLGGIVGATDASVRTLHVFVTLPLLAALVGCGAGGLVPAVAAAFASRQVPELACRTERRVLGMGLIFSALGIFFGAVVLIPVVGLVESFYCAALLISIAVFILVLGRS